MGLTLEQISQVTGLSIEEIKKIVKNVFLSITPIILRKAIPS